MNGIWVVFHKEVVENIRDHRTVVSALLFGPLFGPLIFAGLIAAVAHIETERSEQPLELPVVGTQHATNLIRFLEQHSVQILPGPEDPEASVRSREQDLVLVIPERFGERFRRAEVAIVQLVIDRSRREVGTKVHRAQALLESYGRQIGALRLQARGVDPGVMQAVAVAEQDVSTAESRGAIILAMLPYLVMMSLFIGGMYLAIDTTAGERERGSLEPLLINPVPRWALMAGKLGATTAFALLSLMLTLLAFSLSLRLIPADKIDLEIVLGVNKGLLLFLIVAPVAPVAAALQTIIAAFSRGFREAQTYVSLLVLVPMIPSLALILVPVKAELWMMLIPILAQNLLVDRVVRGERLELAAFAVSALATLAIGVVLAWLAARLYRREQI